MDYFASGDGMANSMEFYAMEMSMLDHVTYLMEQPADFFGMDHPMTYDVMEAAPDFPAMEYYPIAEQAPPVFEQNYLTVSDVAVEQLPLPAVVEPAGVGIPARVLHVGQSSSRQASSPRKRQVCSNEQWEKLKPIIEPLWLRDKKTLPQIRKILAEDHDFHPTKRQFDRIFIHWNWRRNIRRQDMETVIFREQYRSADGRKTAARIGSRDISAARIDRWKRRRTKIRSGMAPLKRGQTKLDNLRCGGISSVEANLPGIQCYTPESNSDNELPPPYPQYANIGITHSPQLSRMMETLSIDIPTLHLDSTSEVAASDQLLELMAFAAPESGESTNMPEYLASSYSPAIFPPASRPFSLVMEVSPFPYSPPENAKRLSPVRNSYSLRYKMAEETHHRRQLYLLKAMSHSDTSPEFLGTLSKLGEVFMEQGVYKDAERIFRHVAISRERLLTYDDVSTLKSYWLLGSVLYQRDHTNQLQPVAQRLYETTLRNLGPDHEMSVLSTDLMSACVKVLGDSHKAEMMGRQVLQILLQKLGPLHESSIKAMTWLSRLLRSTDGAKLCRIALQLSNDSGDALETCAIDASNTMALIHMEQVEMDETLRLFQYSLNRTKSFYGPNHCNTLLLQSHISKILASMNRFAESERLSLCTLEQLRNIHQARGPIYDAEEVLGISANILKVTNRSTDAEKWYLSIINYLRNQNRACDYNVVKYVLELGDLYVKQERYDDAIAIYRQLHEEFEGAGVENKLSLSISWYLARSLSDFNCYDEAIRCYPRLIEQSSRLLGETHEKTLAITQDFGHCYGKKELYNERVNVCRSIYRRLQLSASSNEHTRDMCAYFGRSLFYAGLFGEAAKCFQSLIEQQENHLGQAHSDTISSYKWLGACYRENSQQAQELELYQRKFRELHNLGIESQPELRILFMLGCAQLNRGSYLDATETLTALIDKQEKVPGANYKDTIKFYEKLGDCYVKEQKYKEQLDFYQQKSERLKPLEIGIREELRLAFLLGAAQFNAGSLQDATESFRTLTEREEKLLGSQHRHTVNSHYWLEDCCVLQEINDLCSELDLGSTKVHLNKCRTSIDADHKSGPPLRLLRLVSSSLIKDGEISDATALFRELLKRRAESFGSENIMTIDALAIAGWVAEGATAYRYALWAYEQAVNSYKKLQSEGETVDEKVILWLDEHISQPEFLLKVREEVASEPDSSEGNEWETDESDDIEEECEDSDTDMMWNNLVEFDDLDEILPADIGVI